MHTEPQISGTRSIARLRTGAGDSMSMRPRLSFVLFSSDRLADERSRIADGWSGSLADRLGVDPHRSGADALDRSRLEASLLHMAEFVRDGDETRFAAADEVRGPMEDLGAWCARHGNDASGVVKLFDPLAAALDGACIAWTRDFPDQPAPDDVVRVTGRLNRAPLMMAACCMAGHARAAGRRAFQDDYTELLAHELASPLNAAEVAAYLLENERVTPGSQELRRLAGQIQRNLRRIRALIGDVRDLSAAHDLDADERSMQIGRVLGDVVAEMAPYARDAGVRLDVEEPIPGIMVPAARVRVILRNLVSNGIKYCDPNAAVRWVRISFIRDEDSGGWTMAVSDNGLGIPREHHPRVFQRFFRLHAERADGTGLGLAIAHETAVRMNGTLDFDSEPGVGSTFRFRLPRQDNAPTL